MTLLYLEHTFLWAKQGGNIDIATLQNLFVLVLVAAGIFFFLIHIIMPYTPLERRFRPDIDTAPPEKVFLSFSKGQLFVYVLNVIGLPIIVCNLFPYPQNWPTGSEAETVCTVVGFVVFYLVPAFARSKIDGV